MPPIAVTVLPVRGRWLWRLTGPGGRVVASGSEPTEEAARRAAAGEMADYRRREAVAAWLSTRP